MSRSGKHRRDDVDATAILSVLDECYGSAPLIAQRLGCSRQLIFARIKEDATGKLREAFDDAQHAAFAQVEQALIQNALSGNVIAQIFYLKTQGVRMGKPYVEMKIHDNGRESVNPMTLAEWQVKQAKQIALAEETLTDFADYGGDDPLDTPASEMIIDQEVEKRLIQG